jgi:uncharacterized protein (TIGR02270 family)
VSALVWLEPLPLRPVLDRLCLSQAPAHRRIGLIALVAHRLDADREIEQAIGDTDPMLRAAGLRAVGEAKRGKLLTAAERALRDADPVCRFWAGWSLALLGQPGAARVALDAGWSQPHLRRVALELALRCGDPDWAREVVRSLAASAASRREAIQAVGIFGDPTAIPWVLEYLDDPEYGRVAGEAISTITGADLAFLNLTADAPDDAETLPEDSELPLPNAAAVREWWTQHRPDFVGGRRHLCGVPVTAAGARHVLVNGYQRQRAAAALELAYHSESGVFRVDARGDWQRRALSA